VAGSVTGISEFRKTRDALERKRRASVSFFVRVVETGTPRTSDRARFVLSEGLLRGWPALTFCRK